MRTILAVAIVFFTSTSFATDLASCANLRGYGYYHYGALAEKKMAGWLQEGIPNGITTLKKIGKDKYDLLVVDARNTVMSFTQDGGQVLLLRKGNRDATFMHVSAAGVIELYTFWQSTDGEFFLDLMQSKGGNAMVIHKSSLMIASCDKFRLDLID